MNIQTVEHSLSLSSTFQWDKDEEITSDVVFKVDCDGCLEICEESISTKTGKSVFSAPINLDKTSLAIIRDFLTYALSQVSSEDAQG